MAYGSIRVDTIENTNGLTGNAIGPGFKNRIINGAMMIDQRNAGASVTPTSGQYLVDRWQAYLSQSSKYTVQKNAGSVTPPVGFTDYLGITSSSAYSVASGDYFFIDQKIEGLNVSDLAWGTANAKTVTLSFWVRSSLTGTFGGSLQNSAQNRSYPFSFTISSANTWEQKSITIAGDTTGTWLTTNGVGMYVNFSLGTGSTYSGTAGSWSGSQYFSATGATSVVGTNGATFYITGVQFEVGSTATSFDYRPYGTELALCQRYYFRIPFSSNGGVLSGSAFADSTTSFGAFGQFLVPMRTAPTALEQSGTAGDYKWNGTTSVTCSAVPTHSTRTTTLNWQVNNTVASGLTAGHGGSYVTGASAGYLGWSAEL